jgi:cell division protein FtsQ
MWDSPRQLNGIALALAIAALVVFAWGVIAWAARQPVFSIRHVVVEGKLQRSSPGHLEAVVREELHGTFVTLRLADARASLQRVPWVKTIALRRQWPDTLLVTVMEHQPLARWTDGMLVDNEGEVFAADFTGDLPQLSGPEGSARLVATRFLDYGAALAGRSVAISELSLSSRGGWRLRTGGAAPLTIEIGRSEPVERLTRFIANYGRTVTALARAGARVDYVDLRYGNGFAVRAPGFADKTTRRTG